MSDTDYKSFTDKATEAIKPASEESYFEKNATKTITNGAENAKEGREDAKASVNEALTTLPATAQDTVANVGTDASEEDDEEIEYDYLDDIWAQMDREELEYLGEMEHFTLITVNMPRSPKHKL